MTRVIGLFSGINDNSESENRKLYLFPYMNGMEQTYAYGGSFYLPVILSITPDL